MALYNRGDWLSVGNAAKVRLTREFQASARLVLLVPWREGIPVVAVPVSDFVLPVVDEEFRPGFFCQFAAGPRTIIAKVDRVSRGDTLAATAANGTKLRIRLLGIDASRITRGSFPHDGEGRE